MLLEQIQAVNLLNGNLASEQPSLRAPPGAKVRSGVIPPDQLRPSQHASSDDDLVVEPPATEEGRPLKRQRRDVPESD